MFYYINHLALISSYWDCVYWILIFRLIETDLGRSTLPVARNNVDTYPFLAFINLTRHFEDTGISAFWLHCAADSKKSKPGKSNLQLSLSACKNISCSSSAILGMKVCPYSYLLWCGYSWSPWKSFVTTDGFSNRITIITLMIGVPFILSQPSDFYLVFWLNGTSKLCKPDNFK